MWAKHAQMGQTEAVLGAAVLIVVLLVVFPPMVIMSGGGMAALLGLLLKADADDRYADSELIDLNT